MARSFELMMPPRRDITFLVSLQEATMGESMNFQVVVFVDGALKQLFPLVSKDVPKALLPVGNCPSLSYVLELLESSNLKDIIVVIAGTEDAVFIGGWISGAYEDRLHVEVASVADDAGTGDGLRARLTADNILIYGL